MSLSYQLIWSINLSLSLKFSITVSLSLTNWPYQHISVISSLQTYVSYLWHFFFWFQYLNWSVSVQLFVPVSSWLVWFPLSLSVLPFLFASYFVDIVDYPSVLSLLHFYCGTLHRTLFDICGYAILLLDFSCCFPLLTVFWKLWKPQVATGMLLASRNAWSVQRGPGHELWALSGPISARAGWSRLRWSRLRRDPADLEINITAEQNLKGPESLHLPGKFNILQLPPLQLPTKNARKTHYPFLPCQSHCPRPPCRTTRRCTEALQSELLKLIVGKQCQMCQSVCSIRMHVTLCH